MAKLIMRVEGVDGQIELLNDRVVVLRGGLMNTFKYGINAKREIPLGAISEVAFKDASALRMGEIEFVRSGRSADEKKQKKASDSVVKFRKKEQADFEALKEKVFEMMNNMGRK